MPTISPTEYERLKGALTASSERIKAAHSPEAKWQAVVGRQVLLLQNYDNLSEEGKAYCDKSNEALLATIGEQIKELPDTTITRKLKRNLKGAKGQWLIVESLVNFLGTEVSKPTPYAVALKPYFLKHIQTIMDFWQDISQNTLSGPVQFSNFYLIGHCVDEFLVAFHLSQRGLTGPAFTHIRSIQESLDLMELFRQDKKWVDLWISDDKGKDWRKLRPKNIRKELKRGDAFEGIYSLLSTIGSHPTFSGAQARVRKYAKESTEGRPKFNFRIGGTPGTQEDLFAHIFIPILIMALLNEVIANFSQFLNEEETISALKESISDYQKYLDESIFPLLPDNEGTKEIVTGLKQSFENILKKL